MAAKGPAKKQGSCLWLADSGRRLGPRLAAQCEVCSRLNPWFRLDDQTTWDYVLRREQAKKAGLHSENCVRLLEGEDAETQAKKAALLAEDQYLQELTGWGKGRPVAAAVIPQRQRWTGQQFPHSGPRQRRMGKRRNGKANAGDHALPMKRIT